MQRNLAVVTPAPDSDQAAVPAASADKLALSINEVAAQLGVSRDTVARLIATRGLPAVRLGHRTVRVPRAALEEWLTGQIDDQR